MGIKLGIVGCGAFAQSFIPLFKAHPLVEHLTLCDLDAEKLKRNAEKHGLRETVASLEELLELDIDAVAILTQHWLHAPQAIQALRAGKHVYSAVPPAVGVEEMRELVKTVEQTGRIYMLGETSYYYPAALYCRERCARGDFGHLVYAEAAYYHDWDHGMEEVMRHRAGERWREHANFPPMYYPTHSTSQIVSVTGAHMTQVSCHGFIDRQPDSLFVEEGTLWRNRFSNETALFRMSDGSSCRINEFRRVGHPGGERLAMLLGTEASFEQNEAGAVWLTKDRRQAERLDQKLACRGVETKHGFYVGVSQVHPVERLPKEFAGLPNGHWGAHQFLVDDFARACCENRMPPTNVWQAARYLLPGLIAHESALRGGELLDIPDLGAGPQEG